MTKSAFAERIGVDRTALSQLLSDKDSRLPRAETLAAIARAEGVSLDWLLGLSSDDALASQVAEDIALEDSAGGVGDSRILEWRREAQGAKIRYAPALLPDLFRLPDVTAHEYSAQTAAAGRVDLETRMETDQKTLELSRTPEADFEICIPRQRLEALAGAFGVYAGLAPETRAAQIRHMADLARDLYPAVRLFVYDARQVYSAPFTVFGAKRAAIYLGDMYLVMNARLHIQALTRRFDDLVRAAEISDREAPTYLETFHRFD